MAALFILLRRIGERGAKLFETDVRAVVERRQVQVDKHPFAAAFDGRPHHLHMIAPLEEAHDAPRLKRQGDRFMARAGKPGRSEQAVAQPQRRRQQARLHVRGINIVTPLERAFDCGENAHAARHQARLRRLLHKDHIDVGGFKLVDDARDVLLHRGLAWRESRLPAVGDEIRFGAEAAVTDIPHHRRNLAPGGANRRGVGKRLPDSNVRSHRIGIDKRAAIHNERGGDQHQRMTFKQGGHGSTSLRSARLPMRNESAGDGLRPVFSTFPGIPQSVFASMTGARRIKKRCIHASFAAFRTEKECQKGPVLAYFSCVGANHMILSALRVPRISKRKSNGSDQENHG